MRSLYAITYRSSNLLCYITAFTSLAALESALLAGYRRAYYADWVVSIDHVHHKLGDGGRSPCTPNRDASLFVPALGFRVCRSCYPPAPFMPNRGLS